MVLSEVLLNWYDQNARQMPWRSHPSPYRTWVSEVMLQQTQVDTVLPYFERFMARFPNIEALANAAEGDVLKLWEGLGYYSRARNLHKAAQLVISKFGGEIPSNAADLRKLPGIGAYTAGAILSIAFGQAEPALDGNIRRVYARVKASKTPVSTPKSDKELWAFSREVLPAKRAGDFNQALMDLGATICKPANPLCLLCPISQYCQAYLHGKQAEIPVTKQRPSVPHWIVTAAVIERKGKVLIQQRAASGLLGGLWEFPGGKLEPTDANLPASLRREIMEELNAEIEVGEPFGVYKHAYTHFKITLHAYKCKLIAGSEINESRTVRWLEPGELTSFAMGKVDRLIAERLSKT